MRPSMDGHVPGRIVGSSGNPCHWCLGAVEEVVLFTGMGLLACWLAVAGYGSKHLWEE